jgi:hypothetical protein
VLASGGAAQATPTPKEAEVKKPANSYEIPVSEEKSVDGEIQYLKNLRERLRTNLENEHGDIFSHEKYHGMPLAETLFGFEFCAFFSFLKA